MKIALVLQGCPLDGEAVERNALRIARNEPTYRSDVEFVFSCRFDWIPRPEVVQEVSQKFRTSVYRSKRRGTGHPAGCNDLWCGWVTDGALKRVYSGEWNHVKAMFTFEGDAIPVHPDWISKMSAEWDRAAALGKFIVGCWHPVGIPGTGHVNGNMLVAPDIGAKFSQLLGCPPDQAWDMYFGGIFEPHWHKSGFIANYYKDLNVTAEQINRCWADWKEPAVVIHGVKDKSVEAYAAGVLRDTSRPPA